MSDALGKVLRLLVFVLLVLYKGLDVLVFNRIVSLLVMELEAFRCEWLAFNDFHVLLDVIVGHH